jgi:hypothetical protein
MDPPMVARYRAKLCNCATRDGRAALFRVVAHLFNSLCGGNV